MRRAIVHIGMPRTGTTSLQAVLSAWRGPLASSGVLYPDFRPRPDSPPHLSHQYLGEAFDGRRPRRELRELLAKLDAELAAAPGDVVILSYEGLSQLPSWHCAPWTLRDLFARHGFAMEIAVTIKAQDLYAQSQYTWRCQFLREPRFFSESLPRMLRQRRFNYVACVRPWAIAAAGRIVAVPVHQKGSSVPLIGRLLEQLGLAQRFGGPLDRSDLMRWENRSMGAAAIEIARRIRERSGARLELGRAREVTRCAASEAQLRGLAQEGFQALHPADRQRIMDVFSASNDRFARSIWGGNWSRHVASAELPPANAFGPDSPRDHVDGQIDAVVMHVCRRFGLPLERGLRAGARNWFARLGAQVRHRT